MPKQGRRRHDPQLHGLRRRLLYVGFHSGPGTAYEGNVAGVPQRVRVSGSFEDEISVSSSGSFEDGILLRSPRNSFIFIIYKIIFWIKVSLE